MRASLVVIAALAGALLASSPALAQQAEAPGGPDPEALGEAPRTPASSGTDVYPRAFFDRVFPQTAPEMLQRVPGFALQRGADLRGFAGAAGNVSPRWTLKLLALGTLRDGNVASVNRVAEPVDGPAAVQRFATANAPLELLTRATLGQLKGAFRPEFGVEIACSPAILICGGAPCGAAA